MDKLELPIGDASFRNIRTSGCYYVDKTPHLWSLAKGGRRYWFLSRPRRFGKSLLVSTLKELFEGNEKLFRGLYIHDQWDWKAKHPVVRLSFDGKYSVPGELEKDIIRQLRGIERRQELDADRESDTGPILLQSIVDRLNLKTNQQVVVLVDEYDKPILETLENRQQAEANRDYLRGFYGVIKGCADYIRFVFVTGISMYSRVSLFSNLNNLNDISLAPRYATICGYTDEDLRTVFEPELVGLKKEERQEIQRWYNGYHWRGKEKVYNPFDIMLYLQNREFQPYWYETGTPTWLYHLMKRGELSTRELKNLEMYKGDLSTFDLEKVNLNALLFQCGYLTIAGEQVRDGDVYFTLDYPNREVRLSLNRQLLAVFSGTSITEVLQRGRTLVRLLVDNDFSGLQEELKALFAGIPYSFTAPLRGSRWDTGASPQSLRWGDAEAVEPGASRPPTESAVAFGSASSTPPQGGSDSVCGSASSADHQGGSDSVCGSASSADHQGGSDSVCGSASSADHQGGSDSVCGSASSADHQGGSDSVCGSASSADHQGGSDSVCGSASSADHQGGSDSVCGSASSADHQGGSDSVCGSASSAAHQGESDFAYDSSSSADHQEGSDGGLSVSLTTSQGGNDVEVARYEGYYASILYAIFSTLNLDIRVEDASVRGRADIVVIYQKQVFIFELKVKVTDGSDVEAKAEQALAQMRDRDYAGKYRTDGNRIHLLAVVFDREKRNLAMVRVESA